jgi:hypothetical protein
VPAQLPHCKQKSIIGDVRSLTRALSRVVYLLLARRLEVVYFRLVAKQNTAVAADLPKPSVRPLSETQFAVAFRGQSGHVFKDEKTGHWHAFRNVTEQTTEGIYRVCWRSEDAFEVLVARLAEVADCRETAVAADKAESKGLRKRLAELGGEAALAAYDAALVKVQRDDASGLPIVLGMTKVAAGRKLPKAVDVPASDYSGRPYAVRVVPGFSVQVNEQVYFIGGQAEYGSYNLHYFGQIMAITANTITVSQDDTGRSKCRRMKIGEFAWRNDSDPAHKHAQDAETMQYI